MPKETIFKSEPTEVRAAQPATEAQPASSGWVQEKPGLTVGWNQIGWVQLSVQPHEAESTGDWTIFDLGRDDINRLIRVLRRARDKAYGTDA